MLKTSEWHGPIHAAARAVAGAPVYASDAAECFDMEAAGVGWPSAMAMSFFLRVLIRGWVQRENTRLWGSLGRRQIYSLPEFLDFKLFCFLGSRF